MCVVASVNCRNLTSFQFDKFFLICFLLNDFVTDHYDVFTLLVAIEKLRLAGQLSEEEWSLFCDVKPHTSSDDCSSDTSGDDFIPEWIDSLVWKDVTHLDTLPGFQGLKEAILSNSALWKEYFEVSLLDFRLSTSLLPISLTKRIRMV